MPGILSASTRSCASAEQYPRTSARPGWELWQHVRASPGRPKSCCYPLVRTNRRKMVRISALRGGSPLLSKKLCKVTLQSSISRPGIEFNLEIKKSDCKLWLIIKYIYLYMLYMYVCLVLTSFGDIIKQAVEAHVANGKRDVEQTTRLCRRTKGPHKGSKH